MRRDKIVARHDTIGYSTVTLTARVELTKRREKDGGCGNTKIKIKRERERGERVRESRDGEDAQFVRITNR